MKLKLLNKKGFTLVEILISILILTLLSLIVVFVLNPLEILKSSRDSQRLNDLTVLNKAINYIQANEPNTFLGNDKIVYISLPDETLSSGQTSTCSSLDLPTLPNGYSYYCVSKDDLRKNDGLGWIPINFSNQSIFKISSLPIDPKNNLDYYYVYIFNPQTNKFELNSRLESEKQKEKLIQDGGDSNFLYEIGSDLTISPLFGLGNSLVLKNESNNYVKNDLNNIIYITNAATIGKIPVFIESDKVGDSDLFWDNTNNRLGVGLTNPGSNLSIAGGVSIGSSYALNTAPSNGLIIEGNVGIGTNNPATKLHIMGDLRSSNIYLNGSGTFGSIASDAHLYFGQINRMGTNFYYGSGYYSNNAAHEFFGGSISGMSSVVRITSSQSNKPALVIKAHSSQTANLQEWKNSSLVTLSAIGYDGSMVIGSSTPSYKLDVWGDIRTTGCLIYNGGTLGTCASEQNLKNIIGPFEISGALDKIIKLQPIKYTFKSDPAGQIIIGLLAEDVEQFAPELIIKDENSYKKINYGQIQWLQIEAIKEFKNKIDKLEIENQELKNRIQQLENKF